MNNKILKYLGGFVILIVVFLLGISVGQDYTGKTVQQVIDTQNQAGTVSVMIDKGNGEIKILKDITVEPDMTVFDALKLGTDSNAVALVYKDFGGDLGVFVDTIDGVGKDPAGKKWWQYWVNNTYSQVGASSQKVQPGDIIEFKFIQGQE